MNLNDFKKEKKKSKKINYSKSFFFASLLFLFFSGLLYMLARSANITLDVNSEGVKALIDNEHFNPFISDGINKIIFMTKLEPFAIFSLVISLIFFIISILTKEKKK